mgnify:FL=1
MPLAVMLLLTSACVMTCVCTASGEPLERRPKNTSTVPAIVKAAYEYLESHLMTGARWGMPYHFYRPSLTKYSATQWLWDSGSHMITWSHRNVTNAILDLRTMLQLQHDDGFIPEEIYWGREDENATVEKWLYYGNVQQANNSQMPVLAHALRAIFAASGNDTTLLREFVPKLVRYWDWWWNERMVGHHGLISIMHGWESGLDASPLYDLAYNVTEPRPSLKQEYPKFEELMYSYHFRYHWNRTVIMGRERDDSDGRTWDDWFIVEDVGVNSVYGAGWDILGDLALAMGDNSTADRCYAMAQTVTDNIIQHCWTDIPFPADEPRHFVSYYKARNGTWCPIMTETVQSVMVVMLPRLPLALVTHVVEHQLRNQSRFGLPFPVPSVSRRELSFNPVFTIDLMWRGPSWAFPNWFVMDGLWLHGHRALLNDLMDRWIDMVRIGGIYEMYNPFTAAPYGQEGLGMSCLIVDWLYRLGRV